MDTIKIGIAALVRKAINGDQLAIKEIYFTYTDKMYNICFRMTANREDAEDILQDSFISAFNKLTTLRDPEIFEGWLRQIIINNCLIHARKKRIFEALPDTYQKKVNEVEDSCWLEENSFEKIHEAIKKLPDGCRQIFLLYTVEDFKHKEIGRMLQISESTSKSQYLRAKKLLLDYLKNDQWII